MKRSVDKPFLRSEGEMRYSESINYSRIVKEPSKINPVFLERPHYGIPEPVKVGREVNASDVS